MAAIADAELDESTPASGAPVSVLAGSSSMIRNSGCGGSTSPPTLGLDCSDLPHAAAAGGEAASAAAGPAGGAAPPEVSAGCVNSTTRKPGRELSSRVSWLQPSMSSAGCENSATLKPGKEPSSKGAWLQLAGAAGARPLGFSGVWKPPRTRALLRGGCGGSGVAASNDADALAGAGAGGGEKPAALLPAGAAAGLVSSGPASLSAGASALPPSCAGCFWELLMPNSARDGPVFCVFGANVSVSFSWISANSSSSLCRKTVRLSGVTFTSTRSCPAVNERMTTGHIRELYWW
mmetsp:Transcript_28235/g.84285  ORF Transcript_28235/g.84285 Transcript_28235/m.84285 type:complete len:292 (+) Transcript_28235:1536-2411(+)